MKTLCAVFVTTLLTLLSSCNGTPPIPQDCRIFGCGDGYQCVEQEGGTYACEPIPPCSETGCPAGQVCDGEKCRPATCLDVGCPEGQQCLESGQCVPDNCPYNGHPEGEPLWPWCSEVNQKCSSAESPCRTNPSSDPYYCEEAVKCNQPPPLPEPQCDTFTDRGGTLRIQSDACDCYIGQEWQPCEDPIPGECPEEIFLIADSEPAPEFMDEVFKATTKLGDLRGHPFREVLDALAAQLRTQRPNWCVISGKEAIFMQRSDFLYEENHAVYSGDSSWTNNGRGRYIGCHRNGAVVTKCPSPWPNMAKMKFNAAEKGSHLDTTLTTVGQPEFCASIGYCCMPGTGDNVCGAPGCIPRGGCPVRGDGDPDRSVCESELCNQKWECNGTPVDGWRGNPAQTACRGHYKTWCANSPGVVLEGDR